MTFEINSIPLNKNEDFIIKGTYISPNELVSESFDYMICFDGHGDLSKTFMTFIRNLPFEEIIHQECLATYIQNLIVLNPELSINAGSTLVYAKIYKNKIIISSVGDSTAFVYINNELIYVTPEHTLDNESEQTRLNEMKINSSNKFNYIKQPSESFQLVSETLIKNIKTVYNTFMRINEITHLTDITSIAMTQSLGHHNLTGCVPTKEIIYFTEEDKVDIIIGSDGAWDIIDPEIIPSDNELLLFSSAEEIALEAEKRWKQDWNFMYDEEQEQIIVTNFESKFWDDISVGVWRKKSSSYNKLEERVVEEEEEQQRVEEEEEEEEEEKEEEEEEERVELSNVLNKEEIVKEELDEDMLLLYV
jgi:serine/threonine protein phosphatase PrpC